MIKLLVIIVLGLLWSGSVYAETIVFHKCWEPRIKNAYGDKVKSFKEFSKYLNKSRDFKDYIIKIDTDKSSILSRFILSNGFDPIDPKTGLPMRGPTIGLGEYVVHLRNPTFQLLQYCFCVARSAVGQKDTWGSRKERLVLHPVRFFSGGACSVHSIVGAF